MPYCPKCRIEFLSGIETCSECGASLVDELPEGEEVLVPDWDAMDERERSMNAQREADQFRNAASTVYVKKQINMKIYIPRLSVSRSWVSWGCSFAF